MSSTSVQKHTSKTKKITRTVKLFLCYVFLYPCFTIPLLSLYFQNLENKKTTVKKLFLPLNTQLLHFLLAPTSLFLYDHHQKLGLSQMNTLTK